MNTKGEGQEQAMLRQARKEGRIVTLKCESTSRAYDQAPKEILVMALDSDAWYGRPTSNLACPTLTYPRYAWVEA